ncbi:MAG: NAD(P)/FAD-dependent oxidoreductase, partial [Hyphomicrobiales bacterium]|nr:NAD(P)/FAD-dependent oxidoreductase [Hyphomicrobiales bacterium]
MLAEAGRQLGGRVPLEAQLPGLSEWNRVRDYRLQQIERMANVEIYRESRLTVDDVFTTEAEHIVIATGATWRRDGFGRTHVAGLETLQPSDRIFTPDDIMAGRLPKGRVLIFDDDNYYMGPVIAERLSASGCNASLVTPESKVGAWGRYTAEQIRSQKRLIELEVDIQTGKILLAFKDGTATVADVYTGQEEQIAADNLVLITARQPNDSLYWEVLDRLDTVAAGSPLSVKRIGDCEAPAIIAAAVYSGHRYARELDSPSDENVPQDRLFDVSA